jgi:hypothetical protein
MPTEVFGPIAASETVAPAELFTDPLDQVAIRHHELRGPSVAGAP